LLAFIRKYQLQILLGVGSWVMLLAETLHATNSHPYVNSSALFNTLVNDLVLFVFLFTNFLLIRQGFNTAPQQKLKALLTQILGIGGAGLVLLSIAIGISLWTVNTPIEFQILAIRKSIGLYVFVIFLFCFGVIEATPSIVCGFVQIFCNCVKIQTTFVRLVRAWSVGL
jgi:hypothetical protein